MLRALLLPIAVVLVGGCTPKPHETPTTPPPSQPPARQTEIDQARGWLRDFGLEFTGASIPVVTVSQAEAAAELGRRADSMWPDERVEHVYGAMWLLLGNEVLSVDPDVVRAGMKLGATQPTIAYYGRQRIALIDKEAMGLAPRDLILTHEVVHAYQDQQIAGGIFERLATADSIDALTAMQLAIEGHAQFVGMAAFLGARGVAPERITPSFFDSGTARIASPGVSALYERGAVAMLAAYRRGGLPAIDALMKAPPATSEQMLHPQKVGRDEPTIIEVPEILGAQLRWKGSLGEFMMQNLLATKIPDRHRVVIATTGWDGDAIAWFDTKTGPVLIWRTVWDRPEDAEQFFEALSTVESLSQTADAWVEGRTVDIVVLAPPASPEDGRSLLESLPPLTLGPSDGARSTQNAEREYLAQVAAAMRVVDGGVQIRDSGVRIPVPKDWQVLEIQGAPVIRAPMVDGFGDNILVNVTPNLLGFTLDAVETETLRQFNDVLGATVVDHRRTSIAGREAWVVETVGHEAGSNVELHQVRAVFFTQTHRVIVTATARPDRWSALESVFASVFEGITRAP